MKQKSTFLKVFMTLLLLMGVSSVWGADVTYKFTPDNATTGNSATAYVTTAYSFTFEGIGWSFNQWNPKTLQIKTNQSSAANEFNFKNTSAFPGKIKSVVIKFSALSVSSVDGLCFVGGSSAISNLSGGSAGTWDSKEKTLTWTPSSTDNFTYFAFYQNGKVASGTNYLASSNAITITYEGGNTPSISANNIDLAADATSGEIAYTISNSIEGKSLTAETSTEWISNITVDAANSKVTFNTTANEGAQREGTITLKYDGATDKNVTITQAKPTTFASLAALVAAGAPASDGTETVTVTLTNEVIKSFYTSSGNRNGIYLNYTNTEDNDIEIYCKNVPDAWVAGGTVSGTLENCTWKNYNGTWELCPENWNGLTYTAPATYAINIDDAIANGTVEASVTEAAAGVEVSLTVTPANHYELASLSVKDEDDNDITVTDYKFTMPANDVTVSATFAEKDKYTVTYYSLGEAAGSEDVYDGELIVNAPTVTAPAGWEFAGWTTNDTYATSTTSPIFFAETSPVTADVDLYAVFKNTEGGDDATEELTNDEIISLSSEAALSYATEKKYTDGAIDYSIYANTDNTSRHWLQLKKDKGVYVKITAPNKITKVDLTITSATNSSGGINNIALHSSFGGEVALVTTDCTYGTSSESIAKVSDVENNKATLIPSEDVTTVYLKVSSGARIWDINVSYLNATTTYTITGPEFKTVTISEVGYATYSSDKALVVPADETVFGAKINDAGTAVTLIPVEAGAILEAGTGFIVAGNGSVTFEVSAAAGEPIEENELLGTGNETLDLEAGEAYLLGAKDGKAVFALCNEGILGANKACLPAPSTVGANSTLGFDDATGIISVSNDVVKNGAIYNLNGQKVGAGYKGIVIVNGKKMFNK